MSRVIKFLALCLWGFSALAACLIIFIVVYAFRNESGHIGWEPFTSFYLLVPLLLAGIAILTLHRHDATVVRAGICAFLIGSIGIIVIVYLDQSGRVVEYERWLRRGGLLKESTANDDPEKPLTITCKARFIEGESHTDLVIIDDTHNFWFSWSGPNRAPLFTLKPHEVYTFTLSPDKGPYSSKKHPGSNRRLIKAQQHQKVLYDESICMLHGVPMAEKEVPVHYGLPLTPLPFPPGKESDAAFPNYDPPFIWEGCCVADEKVRKIYVCNKCQEAYLEWKKQHSNYQGIRISR